MPDADLRLPDTWSQKRLGEVALRVMVGIASAATHAYRPSGVVLLRNLNIKPGRIADDDLLFIDPEYEKQHARKRLIAGDVITVRTGDPGVSAVVPKRYEGAQCFTSLITRPNPALITGDYLCMFINSRDGQRQILNGQAGGAQQNVNASTLEKLVVVVPSLSEQRAITALLGQWDKAVGHVVRLVRARRKLKRGLLQQLLTGERRFPEFRDQPWERLPLGELLQEQERHVEWSDDAIYRLVSVRRRSGGFFDRERRLGRDILTKSLKETHAGDFVLARMQVLHGAMTVTPLAFHGAHVSDSYMTFVARVRSRLHMPYLGYLSTTREMYYKAFRSSFGVAIEKMTFQPRWWLNETVYLPSSIEEQRRITDVFESLDREIQILTDLHEALKEQKKGLMQQLLTGKVRVPASMLKETAHA